MILLSCIFHYSKRQVVRLLFYSQNDPFGLSASYIRAANLLSVENKLFDYTNSLRRNMPFGKLGYKFQQHVFLENLNHKINREFVIEAKNYRPSAILFFTNAPVSTSALMFIKSIMSRCKLILIWPDSLLNFSQMSINNLKLFDYVATYSSTSVDVLQKLTNGKVVFMPLAGDPEIHFQEPNDHVIRDFGFVGGWRPERERYLEILQESFKDCTMEIIGPYWKEKCKKSILRNKIKGPSLHGREMASFFNSTRINLNIIDDTNYPAANMRFFEILTSGGLELTSSCPEMENEFVDGESLFYFYNSESLLEKSKLILSGQYNLQAIKWKGHKMILNDHRYENRLTTVLNTII